MLYDSIRPVKYISPKNGFKIWMLFYFSKNNDTVIVVSDEFVIVDKNVGYCSWVFTQDSKAASVVKVDRANEACRFQSKVQVPKHQQPVLKLKIGDFKTIEAIISWWNV